jgi:hypothetical protein
MNQNEINLWPTLCNISIWYPREIKVWKENDEVIHWQNFVLRYNSSIRHVINNTWIQYINPFYKPFQRVGRRKVEKTFLQLL